MKLLVVTPTLGASPWLGGTIASVAAHGGRHEHVLVAPAAQVAALAGRFPAVRVIAEPGGGMYAAINAGLAGTADWDAFTYLNDDDILLPDFGAVRRAAEAAGGGPVVAYGGVRLIDARGRRLGSIPIAPEPRWHRALYAARIEPVYQHGTVVTRAAGEAIGGFDPTLRFCGDSDFLARACVAGLPFVCATRRAVAAFRLRAGQLTKQRAALEAERRRVDEKLRLREGVPAAECRRARWRFRLANVAVYAERFCRHGVVRFDDLLARAG
jgi:hypothetical protein